MAKSGIDYLREADTIHKEAVKIRKTDPQVADRLETIAHSKRNMAVKRLKTRVRKNKNASSIGIQSRIV